MNTHNTFEQAECRAAGGLHRRQGKGDGWVFDLPPKSVVVATLN